MYIHIYYYIWKEGGVQERTSRDAMTRVVPESGVGNRLLWVRVWLPVACATAPRMYVYVYVYVICMYVYICIYIYIYIYMYTTRQREEGKGRMRGGRRRRRSGRREGEEVRFGVAK